jgi:hypothetical protein
MTPEDVTRREFMSAATAAVVVPAGMDEWYSSRKVNALTRKNSYLAQESFKAFRKTVRPNMIWNPFVIRLTRELQRFGDAFEAGKRPKLAICTPPQHGKLV